MNGRALLVAALTCAIVLCACGGGGGGGNNFVAPPPPPPGALVIGGPLPDAVENHAYSATLSVSGGTAPYTWASGKTTQLPTWASVTAAGVLSFTTPLGAWGNLGFGVSVSDSSNPPKTLDTYVTIWVSPQLHTDASHLSAPTLGAPYSGTVQITGGKQPLTASIVNGSLPPGLSIGLTSGGSAWSSISGTPTQQGNFSFTIRVTDSTSPTPQVLDTPAELDVNANFVIVTTQLADGVSGRPYTDRIQYVNATPPITWQPSALPGGLTIASDGTVSGDSTQINTQFTLIGTDSSNPPKTSAPQTISLNIYGLLFIPSGSMPSAIPSTLNTDVGDFLQYAIPTVGGKWPITMRVVAGNLPPGVALDQIGHFVGSPTAVGSYPFAVRVTDSFNPPQVFEQPYTMNVSSQRPSVLSYSAPAGFLNQPYHASLQATAGSPPYTWGFLNAQSVLPPGLTMSSSGVISGTPTATGTFTVYPQVTDSATPPQTSSNPQPMWIVIHPTGPTGRNDSVATATAVGCCGVIASLSPYADPPDTPNPAPDTDYYKFIANAGQTVQVNVNVNTPSPMDPVLEIVDGNGARYHTCQDPGDDNPPTGSNIIADTTPSAFDDECLNDDVQLGVNINSQLTFLVPGTSGTQTTFYAHVLDFRGDARPDMQYELFASGPVVSLLTITPESIAPASTGKPYAVTLGSTGGTGNVTLARDPASTMPPGISISNGMITGTPTIAGQYTFKVQAADSGSPQQTASNTYVLRVADPVKITTASLPDAQTGVAYSTVLSTTGGTPPLNWGYWSSQWPCCINIDNASGTFSGVPTMPGTYSVNISVNDAAQSGDSKTYTVNVSAGPLALQGTPGPGIVGWIYSQYVQPVGGVRPYALAVAAGSLPAGLTLNSATGEIRGYPTTAGTYNFSIQVSDAESPSQTQMFPLTISVQPSQ